MDKDYRIPEASSYPRNGGGFDMTRIGSFNLIGKRLSSSLSLSSVEGFRSIRNRQRHQYQCDDNDENDCTRILGTSPLQSHAHAHAAAATTTPCPHLRKFPSMGEEELIEMTDPSESFTFTEEQQHTMASLFAGAGSGTLSSIACAPLDLVRTRMQVMGDLKNAASASGAGGGGNAAAHAQNQFSIIKSLREIVQKDGVKGCFRGLGPTLMTVPAFWGLYFPLYEITKKDLHSFYINYNLHSGNTDHGDESHGHGQPPGPIIHMSSAILAGGIADFFCNPMFVVRTRMQTEALHYMDVPIPERKPHGIVKTIQSIHAEAGLISFWRGFTASLLGLSHVGIQFPVYEFLKQDARNRSCTNEESAVDLLLASGASKMIATSVTYPHEVIRSRLMDYRGTDETRKGLVNTVRRVVRNEGFAALYAGIHVSLVRVMPNCCITFMTYEMLLRTAKTHIAEGRN